MTDVGRSQTLKNGLGGNLFCVALAMALPLSHSVLAGDDLTVVTKIIEVGDPAASVGEGMIFEDFHVHPTVEQIIDGGFPPPVRIDAQGNVTFHAYVGQDGVPDVEGPSGLFKRVEGIIKMITLTDGPAPGTDTNFVGASGQTFLFVPPTPLIHEGRVTFPMAFGENPFAGDIGVWSDRFGELEAVVLEGDSMPGLIPSDALDFPFVLTNGDTIYIDGLVRHHSTCCNSRNEPGCDEATCEQVVCEADPSCCNNQWFSACANLARDLCIECGGWQGELDLHPEGLWRNRDGDFETLILTNEPAIGYAEGIVYGSMNTSQLFGSVGSVTFDDQDRVALTTFVKGPGITELNDEAIYIETEDGLEVFLFEGTPTPEGMFEPGAVFSSKFATTTAFFGQGTTPIRLNNDGALLFPAEIDIPGDPPQFPTLWTTRNGKLEMLVRGFINGVAFAQPGTPSPGIPGGEFFAFPFAEFNDRGDVLISAFVETDTNIFTATFGFWIDRGDGWVPVGFEEGPVPDNPGATFFPKIGNVRGMGNAILQEDGSVLFDGRFFNEEGNGVIGLFKQEADGSARQLLETSKPVRLGAGGKDIRILQSFKYGDGITATGLRPLELRFTDGSSGLYLLAAMAVDVVVGDLDGDGSVGVADLVILLSAWGLNPGHAADFDGNGEVRVPDLIVLLGAWGA